MPALVTIQDATGGLVVRLPEDVDRPERGAVVRASGKLADPYGQLEIRPAAGGLSASGSRALPDPLPVAGASLGEATEGRLVVVEGTLDATITRETSGDVVLRLVDTSGTPFRARARRASGIETTAARVGARLRLTGVVGQRASAKGALDGYRVWLRTAADLVVVAPAPTASPAPSPSPATGPDRENGSAPPTEAIRAALRRATGEVVVEGVVTIPATLLDATARRVIVQDRSAAVEVLVPTGATAPRVGTRVRVAGLLGTAYEVPRIRASAVVALGSGTVPAPGRIVGEPGVAEEGELVRVEGEVVDVARLGDRWRAEVKTSRAVIVVAGLAGAGIPAATLVEGGRATVTGVVRRPHPAASDRRFAVVPRTLGDIRAAGPSSGAATDPDARPAGTTAATERPPWLAATPATTNEAQDADISVLGDRVGRTVRVGGLVLAATEAGVMIDDGTATGEVRLVDEAAALRPLLEPGDAVSATGRVVGGASGPAVEVADAADLVRLGDLGEALPVVAATAAGAAADPGGADPTGRPGALPVASAAPVTAAAADARRLAEPLPPGGSAGPAAGLTAAVACLVAVLVGAMLAHRRLRDRRRLAIRVSARLAAIAGPSPAVGGPVPGPVLAMSTGPGSAEHDASVRGPA